MSSLTLPSEPGSFQRWSSATFSHFKVRAQKIHDNTLFIEKILRSVLQDDKFLLQQVEVSSQNPSLRDTFSWELQIQTTHWLWFLWNLLSGVAWFAPPHSLGRVLRLQLSQIQGQVCVSYPKDHPAVGFSSLSSQLCSQGVGELLSQSCWSWLLLQAASQSPTKPRAQLSGQRALLMASTPPQGLVGCSEFPFLTNIYLPSLLGCPVPWRRSCP